LFLNEKFGVVQDHQMTKIFPSLSLIIAAKNMPVF
jgi:hypothetical protein